MTPHLYVMLCSPSATCHCNIVCPDTIDFHPHDFFIGQLGAESVLASFFAVLPHKELVLWEPTSQGPTWPSVPQVDTDAGWVKCSETGGIISGPDPGNGRSRVAGTPGSRVFCRPQAEGPTHMSAQGCGVRAPAREGGTSPCWAGLWQPSRGCSH